MRYMICLGEYWEWLILLYELYEMKFWKLSQNIFKTRKMFILFKEINSPELEENLAYLGRCYWSLYPQQKASIKVRHLDLENTYKIITKLNWNSWILLKL